MKNIIFALIVIICLGILPCCNKANSDGSQQTMIQTINKNQSFQYNFGLIGIEDNMYINQQATHYEISELKRDSTGKIIYTYRPGLNYIGKDEVEITWGISNGGAVVNSKRIKIKFTVVN